MTRTVVHDSTSPVSIRIPRMRLLTPLSTQEVTANTTVAASHTRMNLVSISHCQKFLSQPKALPSPMRDAFECGNLTGHNKAATGAFVNDCCILSWIQQQLALAPRISHQLTLATCLLTAFLLEIFHHC